MRTPDVWILRGGVLACAAVFLALGILGREHLLILQKAVRICLECIGLG